MKSKISLFLVLSLAIVFVAGGSLVVQADEHEVSFGYINWPGVTVKTHVARTVLETLGYEVEATQLQVPPTYKALSEGNIDIFLGGWIPTMNTYLDPYLEEGSIKKLEINLNETVYRNAVPEYVWEAGVRSLADLDKPEYRDKFDLNDDGQPEFYGIEPGNEGNKIIIEAIENDTYGLGDWEFVPSSTAGMLSQVEKAAENEDWIVFLGWEPHWMNIEWDLKYLKDPERIWPEPGKEVVWTLSREGFKGDKENLHRFFKQFRVTPTWQNDWIYEYTYQENEPEDIAEKWIQNHLEVVDLWTYGVESADGRRARDVIREKYE
ncbi:ABC transporter substrate-binding protein [Candidatus Bipolaricaulota bacterium]|nr:ABC transporter substrate-binding protein [Candidatus Bipolaricaulota bacterium]